MLFTSPVSDLNIMADRWTMRAEVIEEEYCAEVFAHAKKCCSA